MGELNSCNYLMENTKYSNSDFLYGYWIENPYSVYSHYACDAWHVIGSDRSVNKGTVLDGGNYGVRPAIEVLKSNIEY